MTFNSVTSVEHASNQLAVHKFCVEKGWFDKPVTFLDAMALLVTEIVEAHDAYSGGSDLFDGYVAPPELASEFADCYIRLLDYCSRFSLDLGVLVETYSYLYEKHGVYSFDGTCMQLVRRVRHIIEAYRREGLDSENKAGLETSKAMAFFFLELRDACNSYNVNLLKAFSDKMEKNWARPYRHGNLHA
jgi:NTP pyrophosphatase (non-canonical NTP hydrolase)